jgi:hypothetical protein
MSDIRSELLAIRDANGRLTAPLVVEAARPEDAPLHSQFEWDDGVAAEKYRLTQARHLITSVKVRFVQSDGTYGRVNEFMSVLRPAEHGREVTRTYEQIDSIVADEFLTRVVQAQLEREWRTLFAKGEKFEFFREMVINDII